MIVSHTSMRSHWRWKLVGFLSRLEERIKKRKSSVQILIDSSLSNGVVGVVVVVEEFVAGIDESHWDMSFFNKNMKRKEKKYKTGKTSSDLQCLGNHGRVWRV